MAERRGQHSLARRTAAVLLCLVLPLASAPRAGVYVTETSGIRWNDVGGIRWNDVGGIRWNDVGGIRWNDVGGIRWNDVGGILFTDASGIRWNDVGGIRWNDVGGIDFSDAISTGLRSIDLELLNLLSGLPDTSSINVIVTYRSMPGLFDLNNLRSMGILGATIFRRLPKVVGNVRLSTSSGAAPDFIYSPAVEGIANTDLALGHGTFVASVAAGSASGGANRGIAPGASILGLSAGDLYIINVLEGFDYILDNAARYGVRVVNCSWGSEGFFDPDDPVNIATRLLYDAGITVVFAVGNNGPSPNTLNQYAVAPWVIGVGSSGKDGRLSSFSSRGIFEELLYHPALIGPGENIVAASPAALNGGAYYAVESGTSFAAPHVAGVVALMLQANPALAPGDIKRILMQTATPILTRDRSEAGAGGLDAWAALTQAIDAARPFGTYIPGWLDQRPYRIDHRPAAVTSAVVPAGGSVSLPVALPAAALSWQATLAWGTLPGLSDLDLTVRDASGAELARSDSLNAASLFGRTEGTHILGELPTSMTMDVFFKAGTGVTDQPFQVRQESAVAVLTAYTDVAKIGRA